MATKTTTKANHSNTSNISETKSKGEGRLKATHSKLSDKKRKEKEKEFVRRAARLAITLHKEALKELESH